MILFIKQTGEQTGGNGSKLYRRDKNEWCSNWGIRSQNYGSTWILSNPLGLKYTFLTDKDPKKKK